VFRVLEAEFESAALQIDHIERFMGAPIRQG
jgi:hypothetical protein